MSEPDFRSSRRFWAIFDTFCDVSGIVSTGNASTSRQSSGEESGSRRRIKSGCHTLTHYLLAECSLWVLLKNCVRRETLRDDLGSGLRGAFPAFSLIVLNLLKCTPGLAGTK